LGYSASHFFFSSRRRHTRFSRDWSSDVCSSDLLDAPETLEPPRVFPPTRWPASGASLSFVALARESGRDEGRRGHHGARPEQPRSEERRVGKECKTPRSQRIYK